MKQNSVFGSALLLLTKKKITENNNEQNINIRSTSFSEKKKKLNLVNQITNNTLKSKNTITVIDKITPGRKSCKHLNSYSFIRESS